MKTPRWICALLALAAVNLFGQTGGPRPRDTPYAVVNRDANSRLWQGTNWTHDASGEWVPHVHKITELATGLCRKVGSNYVDSSEAIALLPDGTAAATNCATAVYFPADIGSGVIRLVTSDGKVLQNGPAYLAFDDGSNAIIVGSVTNSVGQLISSNQVLYPDIFRGAGFRADLLCTVRKSGFESDVVFREQIPDPVSLGLGANARVELLTEWFNTPEPTQTTNAPNQTDGLEDVTLHFGAAIIGRGKAFTVETSNSKNAGSRGGRDITPVYKSWIHSKNGQAFLVESVPYRRLAPKLKQLPAGVGAVTKPSWRKFFTIRELPSRPQLQASAKSIQMAEADLGRSHGLVLDYVEVSGAQSDYTFSGGMTYFVSAPAYCSGITTIEGGAIIKYPPGGESSITIEGTLTLTTTANNMAIFTAVDDDSVGNSMSGVSGSGYTGTIQTTEDYYLDQIFGMTVYGYDYANPAIELTADSNGDIAASLSNLRVEYANTAMSADGGYGITFANLEVENCDIGFATDDNNTGGSISATNCLLANVNIINSLAGNWAFANCTFDDSGIVNNYFNASAIPLEFYTDDLCCEGQGNFFNCIFFDLWGWQATSGGSNNGFGDDNGEWDGEMNAFFGDNPVSLGCYCSPFVTGPLGDHYLSSSNPFIDAGNTTADQVGLYHYTTQTSQAKDGNTIVDLGYHYVALNSSGNPIDTNGDGIPDYLEDANGNGIWDPGSEPNDWKNSSPDTSGVVNLQVYTPLH